MRPTIHILFAALLTTALIPAGLGDSLAPVGPVEDGGFERAVANERVNELVGETPLAGLCIGIGHQVLFWGDDSPQQDSTGTTPLGLAEQVALYADSDPSNDPDPTTLVQPDPEAGLAHVDDPEKAQAEAEYQAASCVAGQADGDDAVWVSPARQANKPVAWSTAAHQETAVTFGFNYDTDPFDREAHIAPDASASSHNLWQSYASRQQGYTANFDALEYDVEAGEIPDPARVIISLTPTPLEQQNPWVGLFIECQLTFSSEQMNASLDEDGRVSVDPAQASFGVRAEGCEDAGEQWEDADTDERHELLGRLRIMQLSFWSFNRGEAPIVIDNVALPGASTIADEALDGNVNPNPMDPTE